MASWPQENKIVEIKRVVGEDSSIQKLNVCYELVSDNIFATMLILTLLNLILSLNIHLPSNLVHSPKEKATCHLCVYSRAIFKIFNNQYGNINLDINENIYNTCSLHSLKKIKLYYQTLSNDKRYSADF